MDGLTFTSKLIDALAWPLAVVILGVMFQEQVKNLLKSVKHAKGAGIELEFGERAEAVAEQAEAVPAPQPTAHEPVEPGSQAEADAAYFASLLLKTSLEDRPSAVILESWRNIEGALAIAARAQGLARSKLVNPTATNAGAALLSSGLLTSEQFELIRSLRDLRNKVAHVQFEPDKRAAMNYYEASQKVIRILNALSVPRQPGD